MRPFFQEPPRDTGVSFIDKNHPVNAESYALSLVRHEGEEHAYLILEGNENNERFLKVAHLTYKQDTKKTKGRIVYRDLTVEELYELEVSGHHSWTWKLLPEQKKYLKP